MKSRIIVIALCMQLIGCASLSYPNWESVNEASSAYKQPCKEVGSDYYNYPAVGNIAWFKKRAASFGGNNFIAEYTEDTELLKGARYFYCGPGIPLYMHKSGVATIIRNKFNPKATSLDYEKAGAECRYEAKKATIDTGMTVPPTNRYFVPTNNFDINLAQIRNNENAASNYERQKLYHELDLGVAEENLYNECLKSKGFQTTRSSSAKHLAEAEKYCPDIDSAVIPCFIPGVK